MSEKECILCDDGDSTEWRCQWCDRVITELNQSHISKAYAEGYRDGQIAMRANASKKIDDEGCTLGHQIRLLPIEEAKNGK